MFTELWCGLTSHHRGWLTKLRDQIGNLNLLKQWPIVKPTNLVLKVCASFPKTFHPKILPIPDFFFQSYFHQSQSICFLFFLSFLSKIWNKKAYSMMVHNGLSLNSKLWWNKRHWLNFHFSTLTLPECPLLVYYFSQHESSWL